MRDKEQMFALLTRLARSKAQHRAGKSRTTDEVFAQLDVVINNRRDIEAPLHRRRLDDPSL